MSTDETFAAGERSALQVRGGRGKSGIGDVCEGVEHYVRECDIVCCLKRHTTSPNPLWGEVEELGDLCAVSAVVVDERGDQRLGGCQQDSRTNLGQHTSNVAGRLQIQVDFHGRPRNALHCCRYWIARRRFRWSSGINNRCVT